MKSPADYFKIPNSARVLLATTPYEEARKREIKNKEIIFNGTMGEFREFEWKGEPIEVFFRVRDSEEDFTYETYFELIPKIEAVIPDHRKIRE